MADVAAETIGLIKALGIVLGPFLAILAAAFGFLWKRQDSFSQRHTEQHTGLREELLKDYASKEYVEMYVSLVIRPVVESVDRLAESNRELAKEIREQRRFSVRHKQDRFECD